MINDQPSESQLYSSILASGNKIGDKTDDNEIITFYLGKTVEWAARYVKVLNALKSQPLLFGLHSSPALRLPNQDGTHYALSQVMATENVGIMIQNTLNPQTQLDDMVAKT